MGFFDFLKLNNSTNAVALDYTPITTSNSDAQEDISVFIDENSTTNNSNSVETDEENKFDINALSNIESDAVITFEDGSSISLDDYTDYLLNQQVGFETQEEYYQYTIDKFSSYLNQMKATFQTQEDSNGWFSNLYDGAKELFNFGTSSKDVEDSIAKYEELLQGLKDAVDGKSDMTFEQAYEYYCGTSFSKEKIDEYMEISNIYSVLMVGGQYDEDYLEKFEQATGVSANDVISGYAQSQLDTFGKASEVQSIIDEYVQDQQGYADKLSSAVSIIGTGLTVVGAVAMFVNPAIGFGLMKAGNAVALCGMFIDNAVDLVDDATDSDGLTKEELGNFALETGVEVVSYAAGRGIGKITNGLNNVVSQKVAQAGANKVVTHIAGQAAETVVDTALSLGADYAIAQGESLITTGEFIDSDDYWSLDRFLGEGKNQLIGIITGISSEKIDAYQKSVITTAQAMILDGDTDGAKLYLKKSGMKMNNASFDGFVKNVQDIDAQMRLQTAQTDGVEVDTNVAPDVEVQKSAEGVDGAEVATDVEAQKSIETVEAQTQKLAEVETQEPAEVETRNMADGAETENRNPFATENADSDVAKTIETEEVAKTQESVEVETQKPADITIKAEESVDYSKLTYEEKLSLLAANRSEFWKAESYSEAAKLEGTQFEIALKFAQAGVYGGYIYDLATTLKGTQVDNALKLVEAGVDGCCIKNLAKLKGTKFDNALKLAEAGVNGGLIKNLAKLKGTKFDNALKLAEAGVNGGLIKNLAKLKGTKFDNALKLAEAGVHSGYIYDLATTLKETQVDNAATLAKAGVHSNYIKDLAKLKGTKSDNALKLAEAGVRSGYIYELATTLEGTQVDNVVTLAEAGVNQRYLKYYATELDDTQVKTVKKYVEDFGLDGDRACIMAQRGIDPFSQMDLVEVSEEAKTNMFKNFFANNSSADEIIRNTDFSQFGKDGVPLEYSRSQFLADLSAELTKLPTETQTDIIKKLGIEVIRDASGNITGYDGIIDLAKLSSDGAEGSVLELANNFILNNKVVTGDSEVDNALNSLIQGMPEFINIIGKQQHGTHSYSLDTHILETYKAAISDSDYENLSNYQKFELKLMTILHDISKSEGTVDDKHPHISAKYAKDILERYSLSDDIKFNIVENIRDHHWGKAYNAQTAPVEQIAVRIGTVSNYDVQKIFAKADLIGMGNSEFSADKLEGLSDSSQERLVNTFSRAKETTPLVYTSALIKPDLIPSQEVTLPDGTTKTIKSFNLAELPDDYDMEEFGFLPGTKASDITLGVHTANSTSHFKLFEKLTSDPTIYSPQSVSIVSKFTNALFKRFGIAINLKAADVINATHYDQGCGMVKTGSHLVNLTTGDGKYEAWREIIPDKIQNILGITQSEYSELAATIEDYKWLSQIKDSQEIIIGEKTFTGSEIKTAISTAQAELMQMATDQAPTNDSIRTTGDITELVVRRAEVIDDTYILRYNSVDDINNESIPASEREALSAFLADIPQNSTIIFIGYDGYLYSSKANQWNGGKKPTTDLEE